MTSQNKKIIILLSFIVILMAFLPFLALKQAEFGGSDDAGSVVVEEVNEGFEPIATPILEILIDGEIPGEIESLLFCTQTGIGVGIIAFFMGRFYERKKLGKDEEEL